MLCLQMIQFLGRGTVKVVVHSLCLNQIIFQVRLIRRMPELYLSDTQTDQHDMGMLMLVRLLHFVTFAMLTALNSSTISNAIVKIVQTEQGCAQQPSQCESGFQQRHQDKMGSKIRLIRSGTLQTLGKFQDKKPTNQ